MRALLFFTQMGGRQWYHEKPGRDLTGKAPIKGLGDMGRGFWEDFKIPQEVVMMAAKYDDELAERFKARHNLWLLKVLARFFPVTIPFPTPAEEVFFSAALVKQAMPGVFEEAGGRNLMVEAVYVSDGASVERTGYASTKQLMQMVGKLRAAEHGGEDTGGGGTGGEEGEMQDLKRARAEFMQDAGEIAEHEVNIEELRAKRAKY